MPGQLAGCGGQVTGVSTRRGQLVELARVITASPALLTREQQIFARLTDSLAQLIAEDTGRRQAPSSRGCRPSLRRKLRSNKHHREAHCDAVP